MSETAKFPARLVRFATFEADLVAGELRNAGRPVRVQEQPFQILAALLERAGDTITREELRERLWPGESFGDFDQGLNTAINKLREALGDSAANPRFIETLPKRGYRFTYPVETASPLREESVAQLPLRPPKSILPIASALATAAALVVVFWTQRPTSEPQLPLRRFTLRAVPANAFTPDSRLVAVSPNGKHVAIVESGPKSKLWVQDLDQRQPRPIDGSEGALSPFWSPDSSFIAFATGGKLKKVSANGGPVTVLCDIPGAYVPGGSWSIDRESIIFTGGSPSALYTVPASGGSARLLLSPEMLWQGREAKSLGSRSGSEWIAQPHFAHAESGPSNVLFTWFGSEISLVALDLRTGQHRVIGSGSHPFYSSTGHLLYRNGTDLWGRPFSVKHARFSGDAFLVARNATDPTAATDGTLVYRDVAAQHLVWLNRLGATVGKIELPANGIYYPALSPDGRRVAAETWEKENLDVWISDIARGARIRLTSHPATEVVPVWSPHGDEVAFSSYRTGNTDIFARRADSGAEEVRLTIAPQDERVSDWSHDGQYIAYSLVHPKNGSDLWYLKRNGVGKWEPHAILETPFNEQSAKFSPNGRYVAYLSDESGRDELYVREFPAGLRKWPISNHGAAQVRWSRDGRELFYSEAGMLIAVSVRTVPQFDVGASTRLFSHPALTVWRDPDYDVSLDGRTFVLPQTPASQEAMIHVVQNWFAEFRGTR